MKMVKKGLAIVLMTAVLLTVFTPFVVAEEFYTYNGHTYEQGIDRVECLNLVDESAYAELHRAVDAAVLDWDWHLGLLNEQYDVYWNLISYVGNTAESVPMIRFETMSIEEYESNMGSISDDAIGVALY
ncbi:MAG: hypothetical protein IKV35_05065, partial [Clostridia bacterium]|nr:hypothetical protein [Clostridia bacterium]